MDMKNTDFSRRKQALKLADALNAIEGVEVSDYAKSLSERWVKGEITGEQMKALLDEYHKKLAMQVDK